MRGEPDRQARIWYRIDVEEWIEPDHPLRPIKARADQVLRGLSSELDVPYAPIGRPSVPPEHVLKGLLLQALYSIPSERRLVDEVQMNLLYRWFLDLSLDTPVWDATSFARNRERLSRHGLVLRFFEGVLQEGFLEDFRRTDRLSLDDGLLRGYLQQGGAAAGD